MYSTSKLRDKRHQNIRVIKLQKQLFRPVHICDKFFEKDCEVK